TCALPIFDEIGGAGQPAGHTGRHRDLRRDQVRASALSLTSLEIAVGSGSAALPRRELIGIHSQAHRASRTSPFGAAVLENHVETLLFGLQTYSHGPGYHQHTMLGRHMAAADEFCAGTQILDPGVRARA